MSENNTLPTMSLGGSIVPVENLADTLQVAFDTGAKGILLPRASVSDIPTIPGELFAKFQTSFYADGTRISKTHIRVSSVFIRG